MSEYLTPSRVVQVEAPEGWSDPDAFRTEMAPFLFVFSGISSLGGNAALERLTEELSVDLAVPVLDRPGDMLVAWWDGECERTKRWIAAAGRRQIPAMVIRYEGEGA